MGRKQDATRGQDVQVRAIEDGELVQLWNAQSIEVNTDDTKERENRLGTHRRPNRQIIQGHSGTIEFEKDTPALDDLIDASIEAQRDDREPLKLEILVTTYYPRTQERRTYVYPGAVFSGSTSVGGQEEAVTQSLEWQSEPRKVV